MIRTLTIILSLLCLLSGTSCHSPVTDPLPLDSAVEPFENAQVVLPSDGEIAIRWVIPPLDHDAIEKSRRNRRHLKFLVGPEGTPWIGYNKTYLMNPVKQVWVEVLKGYQDLTQLDNGVIIISKFTEFGFMAAQRREDLTSLQQKTKRTPRVALQPIAQLPIPNCRMFRGADNCLYFSGLNKSTSLYEVYLLEPENVTADGQKTKTLTGYKHIFSSPKTINAVSGDGNATYIAVENAILSIPPVVNAAETIFVHPNQSITQLQYNTESGLFYSTNDKIGYVGKNGHLEFFSRARTQMSLNKTSLHVFSEDDFGVLAFDHIDDLSRMNLHINRMVPTEKRKIANEKPEIFAQLGHSNSIGAVAFSPDDKYVISGDQGDDQNPRVTIWHSRTGKEIGTFKGPESGARFVTMSPDNKYALSLSLKEIKVWDLSKGKEIQTISLRNETYQEPAWAAFSPTRKYISVLSRETSSSTLDIWEMSTGIKIKTIKGLAESHNLASSNKYLFKDWVIYDATTWEPVRKLEEVDFLEEGYWDPESKLVAFSNDGNHAALGNFCGDTIVLRDFDNGTRSVITTTGLLLKIDISSDGEYFSAIVDNSGKTDASSDEHKKYSFRVWRFSDGEKIDDIILQDDIAYSLPVSPSPDWSHIVVGCKDGNVKMLNMSTGKEIVAFVAKQDQQECMTTYFDRYIIASNWAGGGYVIWDIQAGAMLKSAKEEMPRDKLLSYVNKKSIKKEGDDEIMVVAGSAVSSDQNHHAKSFNGTVKLFDSKTDQEIAQFITYTDGEWIVITPEGYYNASPNGGKYLNVRIGKNVYGIENYSEDYFRPDLVKAALANVCPEQVSEVLSPKVQQEQSLEVAKETSLNAER
jgi:WD40 repeat protein